MEGPGQGVRIPVPAGGQTFAHDALVVVLDQRIHAVGTHDHFQVGGGGQVVQGGGLAGVQDGVLGGVHRAGSRTAGAAGRGTAAAAGQQTGCTCACGCQTAGFEELAARNRMIHDKIPLSSYFVFLCAPAAGVRCFPSAGNCKKGATESFRYAFVTVPPDHSRVVTEKYSILSGGRQFFNSFWFRQRALPAQRRRGPFLHRPQAKHFWVKLGRW